MSLWSGCTLTSAVRIGLKRVFATPSPRLIPKGEKSGTFTDLAMAPYEGRT